MSIDNNKAILHEQLMKNYFKDTDNQVDIITMTVILS